MKRWIVSVVAGVGAVAAAGFPASALASQCSGACPNYAATAEYWPGYTGSTGISASVYTNVMTISGDSYKQDFVNNEIWHFTKSDDSHWIEVGVSEGNAGTGSCGQYINGVQTSPCNPSGPAYKSYFSNPRFFWAKVDDSGNYFEHWDTNDTVALDHAYQMSIHRTSGSNWEVAILDGGTYRVDDTTGNVTQCLSSCTYPNGWGGDFGGLENQYGPGESSNVAEDGSVTGLQYWDPGTNSWKNWPSGGGEVLTDFPGSGGYGDSQGSWDPQPAGILECTTAYGSSC